MSTAVDIRVIAVGGKFLGDDIGGAAVTVRDAFTGAVLAQGITAGDSGPVVPPPQPPSPDALMYVAVNRSQPLPVTPTTSVFSAQLDIADPTQVEVTAWGPLGARGSANKASVTTWLYPGLGVTAGNGLLLELPGLICQTLSPPTHAKQSLPLNIVANVAMMCGCPISYKTIADPSTNPVCPEDPQPWLPADFNVVGTISTAGNVVDQFPLFWTGPLPGNFTASVSSLSAGTYKLTISAQQISTGNTGVDITTFMV